jgi:hypothetical protein
VSKHIFTIIDKQTNEPIYSGVKADCFSFLKRNKLKPENCRIISGLPNKDLKTTSPQDSQPKGFFKRVFKK